MHFFKYWKYKKNKSEDIKKQDYRVMIKLINGFEVKYVEDFDEFFQNLLKAIIHESKQTAIIKKSSSEEKKERKRYISARCYG